MDIDVKDPGLQRWAAAVVLVLVVLPMYFMSPSYPFTRISRAQTITELDSHHQKLAGDLERARLLVRNLERVEKEYAILNQQWQVAQTLLPEQNEMPDLLRKVTAAGQQSGVEFELFRPQAPVNQGFYSDNPVKVRIAGGYHQTGVFLSRLANLNRIVNVSNLQIESLINQDGAPYTVATNLTITAYTQGAANTSVGNDSATRTLTAQAGSGKGQTTQAGMGH